MYVTPFPQLHPQLPCRLRVVPLSRVMVADASSLLTVMSVAYRPFRRAAYSSGVLSWLRVGLLLVVMACSPIFVFLGVMVWRARLHHCLSARGCIVAHCECASGAVTSGSVVVAQACEGELRLVSVYHDEDCVHFVSVMVVVVLRIFDVGVHGAGGVVAALVGVFEVVLAVHASHAAFVTFDGERVTACEGKGGGAYFVIADGNAGDVAASQNLRVFFCLAVLVEDSVVVQAVGVHVFYCSTPHRACLHVWTRGLGCFAGGVRLVGCSPRGSVFVCLWVRGAWVFVGDWVGRCRAWCFVGAG